jgi:hypothetical protein
MRSEELIPISIDAAFPLAENIAKSKSPKAKFILDLIVDKKDRGYLNFLYAYLRWVDDFVDDPQNKSLGKIKFISRQKRLLKDFSYSRNNTQLNIEESFLFFFIGYAVDQKKVFLIDAAKTMLESIEMDAQRLNKDGIYSAKEMNIYVNKNSKAFFDIMTGFVEPGSSLTSKNIYIGRFATKLFMLRDLADDIKLGFINITREAIESYSINKLNLSEDKNLNNWARNEFDNLKKILFEEALIVKTFTFKLRLFNYYSQIYYLPKIYRLKANNFDFFKNPNARNIRTEIIVYFGAAQLSIKLFLKEILLIS